MPLGSWLTFCKRMFFTHLAGWTDYRFYSPIPSVSDLKRDEARIFDLSQRELPGVDLNVAGQLQLLDVLSQYYPELPFADQPRPDLRYFYQNNLYSYGDAIFLFGMIRHARPARIVEIGSGYSSCVMLDTNERFFDNRIALTFIEPHAARLRSRLKDGDLQRTRIITQPVQQVDLSLFDELAAGDILFVDSSHVAKAGSDVNHILFELLPRLPAGVFVHFHDLFFPFQYPQEWIAEGRFWNEAYMLRSFLQYNSAWRVAAWNQYLGRFYPERLQASMPLCLKNIGGSLWLERLAADPRYP